MKIVKLITSTNKTLYAIRVRRFPWSSYVCLTSPYLTWSLTRDVLYFCTSESLDRIQKVYDERTEKIVKVIERKCKCK